MNVEDNTFQEYSVYYDAPRFVEGQIPTIGERYILPGVALPIPYITDEEKVKMAEEAEAAKVRNAKQAVELRRMAEDLDEECSRMEIHNRGFVPPYMR